MTVETRILSVVCDITSIDTNYRMYSKRFATGLVKWHLMLSKLTLPNLGCYPKISLV